MEPKLNQITAWFALAVCQACRRYRDRRRRSAPIMNMKWSGCPDQVFTPVAATQQLGGGLTGCQHSLHCADPPCRACTYNPGPQDKCRCPERSPVFAVHHKWLPVRQGQTGVFAQAVQGHVDRVIDTRCAYSSACRTSRIDGAVFHQTCGIGRQYPMHHRWLQQRLESFSSVHQAAALHGTHVALRGTLRVRHRHRKYRLRAIRNHLRRAIQISKPKRCLRESHRNNPVHHLLA